MAYVLKPETLIRATPDEALYERMPQSSQRVPFSRTVIAAVVNAGYRYICVTFV